MQEVMKNGTYANQRHTNETKEGERKIERRDCNCNLVKRIPVEEKLILHEWCIIYHFL